MIRNHESESNLAELAYHYAPTSTPLELKPEKLIAPGCHSSLYRLTAATRDSVEELSRWNLFTFKLHLVRANLRSFGIFSLTRRKINLHKFSLYFRRYSLSHFTRFTTKDEECGNLQNEIEGLMENSKPKFCYRWQRVKGKRDYFSIFDRSPFLTLILWLTISKYF